MREIITQKENLTEQTPFTPQEFIKFKEHKKLSLELDLQSKYHQLDKYKKAQRCGKCGNWLKFEVYANKETGEIKKQLSEARFCQVKWCPMCAWLRARKLANELKSVLQQIEDQRQVAYLFLTLTIKNPPLQELRDTLQLMSQAFKRLSEREEFKRAIKGYVRAFEFLGDSTKEGEAHPHIHAILVVDKNNYFKKSKDFYISQEQWAELWRESLRADYTPIIHIAKIKAKNEKWQESDSAVYETIKYCAKPLEVKKLSVDSFKLLERETKGIRQYNKGGLIKTIKPRKDDELSQEVWELMEQEFWQWSKGEYGKI